MEDLRASFPLGARRDSRSVGLNKLVHRYTSTPIHQRPVCRCKRTRVDPICEERFACQCRCDPPSRVSHACPFTSIVRHLVRSRHTYTHTQNFSALIGGACILAAPTATTAGATAGATATFSATDTKTDVGGADSFFCCLCRCCSCSRN